MTKWRTREQLIELLCDLVKIPSISESEAEKMFPDVVINQLSDLSYFKKNPDHLKKTPTGDGRFYATALVKHRSSVKETVILFSHFDVVGVQDYGRWKEAAFQPEELTQMFYQNGINCTEQVRRDIETGNWLFGRGTMDMKCGLALHLSMIEWACEGEFDGNILLVSVPDEEANSIGMRAAVPGLVEIAEEFNLSYIFALNAEPMFTAYPGDRNKYIYTGSIGKIMPGFLCCGKATHVGEPFAGLNGNFMASVLTSELELDTELCDSDEGNAAPPPSNLMQRDLKEGYSVQIPHRAVTLFNFFLLERTVKEAVSLLRQKAGQAALKIERTFNERAERFSERTSSSPASVKVNVMTYEELSGYACERLGKKRVRSELEQVLSRRGELDDRGITIKLADRLSSMCKELEPLIVIFFAPPFYPAVSSHQLPLVQEVISKVGTYAGDSHHIQMIWRHYFNGISDLSYIGLANEKATMDTLITNMPLWNKGYSIPFKEIEKLSVPVINLGPVGRDAHQWTERLDTDYAFGPLPDMLRFCIHQIFSLSKQTAKSAK
ncbi:M20/M25/M40 family metallo-hydrolase [Sporolactobacillus putidus]|uniref:Arginine utilization protein RocB n=1 Tax=Sporolactobacillus putidus TaxID=492735 RepID=A0A917S338_9BACL|nr:M20/M25/M40 family metallo-hydrolase [Sporolactobacillus putidus]GGL55133.1 hypothetical protein GCM10007968_19030 [Sporolactobacillus putidus]